MTENQNNQLKVKTQNSKDLFDDYARYYNLLYRDKDYAAEAEYVASLIRQFHPSAHSILELGSGTGIHASLLAKKGFAVHGIERSTEMMNNANMLAESHKKAHVESSIAFTEGDIRSIRLPRFFDAVIALFHVISYQTTNEDVISAFETARHHLSKDGIFIFDVWYGPMVLTERPTVRIKRMADDQLEITRIAEPTMHPNENLVDVNYHVFVRDKKTGVVKELRKTHTMRYFFKPEIELYAIQTDFKVVHAEEWLSGKPIGCDTWGACFILQTG